MRSNFVGLILCLLIRAIHANPTRLSVEAGIVKLSENGTQLQIETSDLAILNWESFSIQSHETTHFLQPSITSAVLNRVTGSDISQLMGSLKANGKVYLINPNGIIIGKDAVINTAALLASTFQIQTDEFLAQGSLHLSGSSVGKIENLGTISSASGPVGLFARHVVNKGAIEAPHVSVGAGSEFLVQPNGATKMFIRPDSESVLTNEGTIEGLVVELQSDGATSLAINQKGLVQANQISREGGKVFLRSPQGRTEVSGKIAAPGGTVQVLGDVVHLLDETEIDVSENMGGGTILVGGDYQGANPDIQNAKIVWSGPNTSFKANALENGDGGTVILWGDQANFHYGDISARGGPSGGDGGFVEISGDYLEFRGRVDSLAPKGKVGTLLLDPTDIVIFTVPTTGVFGPCIPPVTYTPGPGVFNTILDTDLMTQLGLCNVVIQASGDLVTAGTISVRSDIMWADNDLTLITTGPNSSLNITGSLTSMDGNLSGSSGDGGISLNNNLTTNNGIFTLVSTGDVILADTADIVLTSNNGSILVASTGATSELTIGFPNLVTTSGGGTVTFQSAGLMEFTGSFLSDNASTVCSSAGSITINTTSFTKGNGNLSLLSNGTIQIRTLVNRTGVGTTNFSALGNIRFFGDLDYSLGSGTTIFNANLDLIFNGFITTAGDCTFSANRTVMFGSLLMQSLSGNVIVSAGQELFFPTTTTLIIDSGNLTMQAGTNLTVYTSLGVGPFPPMMGTGTLNLNASEDVEFDGDLVTFIDTTVNSGQDIFIASQQVFVVDADLTCIAGRDLVIPTSVPIQAMPGNLTFVVDNNSGSSAGPGIFDIASSASITTTGGFINFYASVPGVNFFPDEINGVSLFSGNVVCDVVYPNGTSTAPFTVFFKSCSGFTIPPFGAFQSALASLLNSPSDKKTNRRKSADGKTSSPCQGR